MSKWTKFIDSCVGNIARKIQDEFDESKHPRDKGGKFTSKGGEGRGGGKEEKLVHTHKAGDITPERADALNEAAVALEEQGVPVQKILKMSNEGDLEGMQKLLKGGSESSSREGGASASSESINSMAKKLSEDASSADEFLTRMGYDDYDIGDEESVENLIKQAFKKNQKKAMRVANDYIEVSNFTGSSPSSKSAKKVNSEASKYIHSALEDDIRQIAEESADKDEFKYNLEAFLEDYVQDDYADTDERAMDNFGYDKETVHAVAEEMKGEIDDIANDFFEEDDDDTSVTGPEDRDYMNEEDDEESDSDPVAKMRKHLDDDLFELASRSESEEEFISKAERRIKQDLWAAKSAPEELPVKGQKAEYALKKILSEIKSGTSEYW